jgi:hypothetical protein
VINRQLQSAVQHDGIEEARLADGMTPNRKPGEKDVPLRG